MRLSVHQKRMFSLRCKAQHAKHLAQACVVLCPVLTVVKLDDANIQDAFSDSVFPLRACATVSIPFIAALRQLRQLSLFACCTTARIGSDFLSNTHSAAVAQILLLVCDPGAKTSRLQCGHLHPLLSNNL